MTGWLYADEFFLLNYSEKTIRNSCEHLNNLWMPKQVTTHKSIRSKLIQVI